MRCKNPNKYTELEDCYQLCVIYHNTVYYTYFDKSVYALVIKYHWRILNGNANKKYLITNLPKLNGKQRSLLFHHLILNFKYDNNCEIDHINGNGLDNRFHNLRITTKTQNNCNKCKLSNNKTNVAGIYFDTSRNKYAVDIKCRGKRIRLSRYDNINEAVYVRVLAEKYLFGEYRYTMDDDYKNSLCNNVLDDRKHELMLYVQRKFYEVDTDETKDV